MNAESSMMNDSLSEFQSKVGVLNAQSTARHAWLVYGLVRWLQPDTVLEIGPFHGGMTAHIGLALQHNNKGELYTIDNFTHDHSLSGAEELRKNIESTGAWSVDAHGRDRIHIITGDSAHVEWPAQIDLAILDGDRRQPQFKREVDRVIDAGARCFCVHDTQYHDYTYWFMEQFRHKMFPAWDVIDPIFDVGFAVAMRRIDGPFTGWKPEPGHPLYGVALL